MVKTSTPITHVARIVEGETKYILLESLGGDRVPLDVTQSLAEQLHEHAEFQKVVKPLQQVMEAAFTGLKERFSSSVAAVAEHTMMHDGQVVIRVQPRAKVFDMQLSRDLNDFTWELQDQLCELLDEQVPPVLFGFKQEIPGGENGKESI